MQGNSGLALLRGKPQFSISREASLRGKADGERKEAGLLEALSQRGGINLALVARGKKVSCHFLGL